MRMRSILLMLVSVAMLSVLAATGKAQTSGEITGLVTDSSSAAVTGATATVTNKATGATRKVVTNSEGLYSFPSLTPGVYELKAAAAGASHRVVLCAESLPDRGASQADTHNSFQPRIR